MSETTQKTGRKRGRPRKVVPYGIDGAPTNREEYIALLLLELSTSTADLARVAILRQLGQVTGLDSPEVTPPELRAGGKLPTERTELLWLRKQILTQVSTGRMGSTLVESLRSIRARLDEIDREAPPTPEQVEAELREDLPAWPSAHVLLVVEEAIRRGLLQG